MHYFSILRALLEHEQEDLMLKDGQGRTVLHLAFQNGHLHIVQVIESHLDSEEIYELRDNDGNSLLHLACQSQNKEGVLHLIGKRNAKIDARNNSEEAPVHVAAQSQSTTIVDILLKQGANIESRDASGCTPLHHAARCNQKDMIQHLIER